MGMRTEGISIAFSPSWGLFLKDYNLQRKFNSRGTWNKSEVHVGLNFAHMMQLAFNAYKWSLHASKCYGPHKRDTLYLFSCHVFGSLLAHPSTWRDNLQPNIISVRFWQNISAEVGFSFGISAFVSFGIRQKHNF